MSPNVGNFVHDLVEMAKAMETLPQVQAELAQWQDMASKRTDKIMELEEHILGYKAEISALNEKVHASEVAKDAAETMFLEADDRTSRALAFVKATFGNAGALIQALEPPRPQSTPELVPVQAVPEVAPAEVKAEGQSEHPLQPLGEQSTRPTSYSFETPTTAPYTSPEHGEGQSAPMHEAQLEGTRATGWDGTMADGTTPILSQGQSESPLPPATPMTSASSNDVQSSDVGNIAQPSIEPGPAIGEDLEPMRYDDLGYSRQAWYDWADRTGYWLK